jgi:serine beta-lactamase-like protein LACTB, mitochondrial
MLKARIPIWLTLALAAVGLLLLLIPGLWLFASLTAERLHPDPANVPTATHSPPATTAAGAAEKARQIALAHLTAKNLPGLSVAVGIRGDVVWAEGFGFADLAARLPVTPEHRFRIGSASTALTSAAVGLLLDNGQLKLDDEIQIHVPAFPRKQRPVTLRHLMGHTAGVISDGGDEGPLFNKSCLHPAEALQYFAERRLRFEPGTRYLHSNYGWILVSAAVEAAAGQSFLSFMRGRIFDPLGMSDTTPDSASTDPAAQPDDDFPPANMIRELFVDPRKKRGPAPDPARKPAQDQVTPYFPRFSADPKYGLHLMRPLNYSCYAGASVFVSTPSDLVRFALAMHRGKLLQPATVAALQSPQRLASGEETGHGLGWYIKTVTLAGKPTRVIGQDGNSLGGMVASLITIPDLDIAVAVTSNISYADTFSLAIQVAGAFAEPSKQ